MIKHNGKDDFLIRWNSSCFLMYNNLIVIFTFKYVQKVTGNRRILTRHLTISCQIHIYVALQRTNRTATQSSLEEIYVHHRGPSCKQHTTFLQKSTWSSASLPANEGAMKKKKSSSSHEKRWDTRDSGWGLRTAGHVRHSSQHYK